MPYQDALTALDRRLKAVSPLPRRVLARLPVDWSQSLRGIPAERVTDGMSGAEVFRLSTQPASFLKVATGDSARVLTQEVARTAWLAQQGIGVAPIERSNVVDHTAVMQSRALPGQSADRCGPAVLPALARALARLHALPAADCPFDESRAVRLARARDVVAAGEVDVRQFSRRNRGVSPQALVDRLQSGQPMDEEIVVVHGDATLSNMIAGPDGAISCIDCGHVGRADRYLDLAVIAADITGHFGSEALASFVRAYGGEPWDARKLAYYADLYELF